MYHTNNDLAPKALAILRIISGYAFFLHGLAKAVGFPVNQTHYVSSWLSLIGLATVLELIGGVFIILGFLTRPTAFFVVRYDGGGVFYGSPLTVSDGKRR